MRLRHAAIGLLVAAIPTYAVAKSFMGDFEMTPPTFQLTGRPIGGTAPATATPPHLTSSRIAAVGDGALVIDQDSGALIKTDAKGTPSATLAIGRDPGQLVFDAAAGRAYVADRHGDKIHVIEVGAKLERAQTWKTPVEPYAVALTPDAKTLLVVTIADRALVAYDAATGTERWRTALGREPRGLAISPDGTRALVSYLVTGTVDQIDLLESRRAEHVALATGSVNRRRGRGVSAEAFSRASFAVTFLGERQAVVPFQRETPIQDASGSENTGSYGGGFEAPVNHQLAFVGFGKGTTRQATAQVALHQPRALAWDGKRDMLYVAGLGNDTVLQVKHASQATIEAGQHISVASSKRCGPDGLAIAPDGDVLVWCAFTRNVARIELIPAKELRGVGLAKVSRGPTTIASSFTPKQHEGLVLFHASNPMTSRRGALACSTCHPDNRADGLSWRIDKHELQTPILAGRMVDTHPFKWDGGDPDLEASLAGTIKRLGGARITPAQTDALVAYVEGMQPPRAPSRDAATVARGKQLFDGEAGCRTCHDGKAYTDRERHKLTGTLAQSDTPSLIGLHASAPYFHDGSAATLEALLRDRGAVHGMADTAKLSDRQVSDLVAFLETL